MTDEARPVGRPTLYKPEYCEAAEAYGLQGMGKAEIAAQFGVVRRTLDEWSESHPEFLNAITRAREFSLAWWEAQGRKGVWGGKEFNANAYSLQVRNRFPDDWRDRKESELSGAGGGPVVFKTVIEGEGE